MFWNRRAEQIAGMLASEVAGRPLSEVLAGIAVRLSRNGMSISSVPLTGYLFVGSPGNGLGQSSDMLSVYLFDDSPAASLAAGFNTQSGASARVVAPEVPPEGSDGTGRPAAPSVLSGREAEILRLVAVGVPTDSIATGLGISVHTVRNHVRSLRSKLGAKTKLDAVVVAMQHGLLTLDHNSA